MDPLNDPLNDPQENEAFERWWRHHRVDLKPGTAFKTIAQDAWRARCYGAAAMRTRITALTERIRVLEIDIMRQERERANAKPAARDRVADEIDAMSRERHA